MIVLDATVVIALARPDHGRHDRAATWLRRSISQQETFGVPGLVWHALVRVTTNRRIVDPPSHLDDVFAFIDALRRYPGYIPAESGPRHIDVLRDLCQQAEARGNLVADAAIAAIAVENGASVASFDRDFARFPGLRWIVPGE